MRRIMHDNLQSRLGMRRQASATSALVRISAAPKPTFYLIVGIAVGHFATFKTSHLLQTGGLDERLQRAVDLDLYLKLEELARVTFINAPLYLYRQHQGGISQGPRGIEAYQWSRFVRLNAQIRRRRSRKGFLLNSKDIYSLAYEWLVTG